MKTTVIDLLLKLNRGEEVPGNNEFDYELGEKID